MNGSVAEATHVTDRVYYFFLPSPPSYCVCPPVFSPPVSIVSIPLHSFPHFCSFSSPSRFPLSLLTNALLVPLCALCQQGQSGIHMHPAYRIVSCLCMFTQFHSLLVPLCALCQQATNRFPQSSYSPTFVPHTVLRGDRRVLLQWFRVLVTSLSVVHRSVPSSLSRHSQSQS